MSNGMTRNAQAQIVINGKSGNQEMNEEMKRLDKTIPSLIPLKAGASSHNHSYASSMTGKPSKSSKSRAQSNG